MKIHVLTLFPEMFPAVTESSILGRAGEKGILDIDLINIRDYTLDKHKRTDDTPYGGGPGMVMSAQPIFDALRAIRAENKHILYMSPRGRMLDQPMIERMAREEELVILCGHYEGVDQRVLDAWNMEGLLEFDQYTKPQNYEGMEVPEVLCNGNHKLIHLAQYRNSLELTQKRRPDLFRNYVEKQKDLTKEERKILEELVHKTSDS